MRPLTQTLVLAFALMGFAGWANDAVAQTSTAKTPTTKAAAASRRPSSLVARGTIAGFDRASNMLTVKTAKGQEQFTLASSVRIREASKRLAPADLEALNGHNVSVRYTETGGQRTVQSVQVSGGGRKTAKKQS